MLFRRLGLMLMIALSLAAGAPAPAARPLAADHTVGNGDPNTCTQTTLFNTLDLGGSINFNCGAAPKSILIGAQKVITTSASLDGGDKITLSGQNITRLFYIQAGTTLTLTHMTLTKGFITGDDGGAIRVASGGALVIDSSTFSDNHAGPDWSGGAIMSRGALTIRDSTFEQNSAGNGGALNPRDGSSSTDIRNTRFLSNSTTSAVNGWGGAMLVWVGAAVTVADSQFIGNLATSGSISATTPNRGGAIDITGGSSLTVDNSEFSGNAAYFGGALLVEAGGSLTVTRGNLHDNTIGIFDGTQGGGAIYNLGNLLVDASQLHDNRAEGGGGAIANIFSGVMLVKNGELRRNLAEGGGAIDNTGNATILTTTLADNSAVLYGGAIEAHDETDTSKALTITASTLSGNSTGFHGGALEMEMRLVLINVTVSGNSGPESIDLFDRPLAFNNVSIAQNQGRGLNLNSSSPLMLRNTLLAGNAGGNCAAPLSGTLLTSLSSDNTCQLLNGHDNVNLLLSALGNYGGPTLTQMIPPGSPAQDQGGFCPTTDQRGFARSGPAAGLACDIGAVERQGDEPFGWVYLPLAWR